MVTRTDPEEYERMQLQIIALEYRRLGFEVFLEPRIMSGRFRPDAMAFRASDGRRVFIEILNAKRSTNENQARIQALEFAANEFPEAEIDFRYLDREAEPYAELLARDARCAHQQDLSTLLKIRLPAPKSGDIYNAITLMELWGIHAITLRALANAPPRIEANTPASNLLDVYNALLEQARLQPPEQGDDTVIYDLFEVHEAVMAATQGAITEKKYAEQLREHIRSIRKQAREWLKKQAKQERIYAKGI